MCALAESMDDSSVVGNDSSPLRLIPTSFTFPTDGVCMSAITGTVDGRIFMGGSDGCVYEMTYEGRISDKHLKASQFGEGLSVHDALERFYDEGVSMPAVLTIGSEDVVTSTSTSFSPFGKRSWVSPNGVDAHTQPRKCRKVNRSSDSFLTAVFPDVVTNFFGRRKDRIVRIVVDDDRQTLYTLSKKGWIGSFDLRSHSGDFSLRPAAMIDTVQTTQLYLEAVARGQSTPPSTSYSSSTLGAIYFVGSGAGGMEGARRLLKLAGPVSKDNDDNLLRPVSIHVIPPTESSRLTLMAVTSGGLRLYLSAMSSSTVFHGPSNTTSRSSTDPLKPVGRLMLCHVRAPPLEDIPSGNVEGGKIPRLTNTLAKVDASCHRKGCVAIAIQEATAGSGASSKVLTTSASTQRQQQQVGDMLLMTCPDTAARVEVVDSTTSSNEVSLRGGPRFVVPTGLCESVSLPMATALGTDSRTSVIPGGVVWDMTIIAPDDPSGANVERLARHSPIPTESDLTTGLPPPYFPPSHSLKRKALSAGKDSHSNFGFARKDAPSALSIFGSVVSNVFFSRPLKSPAPQKTDTSIVPFVGHQYQPSYRISRRDGSKGFSLSASDRNVSVSTKHRSNTATQKSARLRLSVLRPHATPLSDCATNHLERHGQEMVALNAGGIHFFQQDSVLSLLASTIQSGDEEAITRFFRAYGYKEGCSMCLILAADSSTTDELRRQAVDSALNRAFVPALKRHTEPSGGTAGALVSSTISSKDSLTPGGYEFVPSALNQALHTVVARLLRPIWYRPAVVVTEGPIVRQQWSLGSHVTPAKVELLAGESDIQLIHRGLRGIQDIIKSRLTRALQSVPGEPQKGGNEMDIDNPNEAMGTDMFVTRSIQYQAQMPSSEVSQLTAAGAEKIAQLIEEANIHSLYRLLVRAVQLLNLMSLLRRAQASTELREVEWGLLHGLTFAQLAETCEGQDRLESLLNTLVTASAADQHTASLSAQADRLALLFSEHCYCFFSPSSRFTFNGLRAASKAMACHPSSLDRRNLVTEVGQNFVRAAQHWHSASLVAGRILHKKEKESFDQVAERALVYESPLAIAVNILIQLEDVSTAVQICLDVAANFRTMVFNRSSRRGSLLPEKTNVFDFEWEHALYHGQRDLSGSENGNDAVGVDVSAQDAIDTCFALLFYYSSRLLGSSQGQEKALGVSMVADCAGSNDGDFLNLFFTHLVETGHTSTLISIQSTELESWLKKRSDIDLIYRFYTYHKRHIEAGQVQWNQAMDSNIPLHLTQRIGCLMEAQKSFERASVALQNSQEYENGSTAQVQRSVLDVKVSVHVAQIQHRILQHVEKRTSLPPEISKEHVEHLKTSIIGTSELYNTYAVVLELHDFCLEILLACRLQDNESIGILWKHVFCKELLPCVTRNDHIYKYLREFATDIGRTGEVKVISANEEALEAPLFENGDWVRKVEHKLLSLGRLLYGKGFDYVFPLDFILNTCEGEFLYHLFWLCKRMLTDVSPFADLHLIAPEVFSRSLPLKALAQAGVPYLILLDNYDRLILRSGSNSLAENGNNGTNRLNRLSAKMDLLESWVNSSTRSCDQTELQNAMSSGRFWSEVDGIRSVLDSNGVGEGHLRDRLRIMSQVAGR